MDCLVHKRGFGFAFEFAFTFTFTFTFVLLNNELVLLWSTLKIKINAVFIIFIQLIRSVQIQNEND